MFLLVIFLRIGIPWDENLLQTHHHLGEDFLVYFFQALNKQIQVWEIRSRVDERNPAPVETYT